MAWTTPKTWSDGDIPDADDLNTHIRDQLNALSTHTHSGAAGDGNDEMTGVDTITFDDSGSTPAAPGSNKVKLFSESETFKIRAGASGAATAIALANHTHTQASGTGNTDTSVTVAGAPTSYGNNGRSITQTPSDSTGSAKYAMIIEGQVTFKNANGLGGTVYMNIEKGGTQLAEFSETMPASLNAEVIVKGTVVDIGAANSSTTYQTDFKESGDTNTNYSDQGMSTREIRTQ
tara:strand:+ start:613 stop:1311 length:699 start_codon:yes stop_codon:yes gene_type:complete